MDASKRLLPFGGTREQGSHKSYGLACTIDIMSNCLTGVGPGFVTGGGGSVFTAHNIEAFTDRETYDDWADQFLAGLRTTPPSPGNERVLYPGLLGAELTRLRQEEGIPYHPEVLNWFESIAAELGHDGLAGAVAGACESTHSDSARTDSSVQHAR
jgi:LDH2 family malate/lactate/ureidoglycolate dehydrogenase